MIISKKLKIVICTPTKTGAQSAIAALCNRNVKQPVFEYVLPKHAIVAKGMTTWRRILMVRNPYRRLQSMYLFGILHGGSKGHSFSSKKCRDENGGEWCDFTTFLKFQSAIKHPTWGWNYTKIAAAFTPNEIWKVEELDQCIGEFANVCDIPRCYACGTPHAAISNNAAHDLFWIRNAKPSTRFTKQGLKIAASFTDPDCERFDYPLLTAKANTK